LDLGLELAEIESWFGEYRLLLNELGFGVSKQNLNLGAVSRWCERKVSQATCNAYGRPEPYRQIAATQECERQIDKVADASAGGHLARRRTKLVPKHIDVLEHVSGIRLYRATLTLVRATGVRKPLEGSPMRSAAFN
jgi:hypothetical protein